MKKALLASLIIAGMVMANTTTVQAWSGKKGGCMKCASKAEKCKISKLKKKVKPLWKNQAELGITDDQLKQIKEIKHAAIKEMIQLKADKDIIMVDLKSAMKSPSINVGQVNSMIDAKYATKVKTAKTFVKALADIQQVLTEEQRVKWLEMCKKCCSSGDCGGKCGKGGGNYCPITGKPMHGKGSAKGSMK